MGFVLVSINEAFVSFRPDTSVNSVEANRHGIHQLTRTKLRRPAIKSLFQSVGPSSHSGIPQNNRLVIFGLLFWKRGLVDSIKPKETLSALFVAILYPVTLRCFRKQKPMKTPSTHHLFLSDACSTKKSNRLLPQYLPRTTTHMIKGCTLLHGLGSDTFQPIWVNSLTIVTGVWIPGTTSMIHKLRNLEKCLEILHNHKRVLTAAIFKIKIFEKSS